MKNEIKVVISLILRTKNRRNILNALMSKWRVFTNCPIYSSFWDDGRKIRIFDFGEFPFTARNIENLVFQSAERGRRTRLVAKCKPEKQRASELAK